jgi:acyl carrier protein
MDNQAARQATRQETISEIIRAISKRDAPPDPDESLFDSGLLDSFALPDVLSALERAFSIKIPDSDLNPRKFDSIARIDSYIESRL